MSKSATEQFQIKKKRKHHKQLLNCKLSCKRSETTALHFAPPANTLIKENFKRLPQENLRLNLKPAICTLPVVNQTRNIKNCLRDQTQVLFCKSRDTVMPLSQGFYVKGAIASKRGLKSMRLNSPNVATAMTSISSMPSVAKKPRRASENMSDRLGQTAASQLTNQLLQGQTTNNLQLSYLLGESLARHGRLQEAFNLYALIASEQPEGFIPLEKLHILATALIEHVRALCLNSRKAEHSEIELMDPITATFTQTKGTNGHKSGNNGSRSNKPLNAGLPTQGWQVVASNLTTRMPAFGGNEEEDTAYDLHSPLRDLSRVSSPFLSEEYDPLLCPLCRDILRSPVTTNCGHTFCRQCCETITMCNVCHIKFPKYQRDDYATETTITKNCISAIAMTTASTITTSTSNISGPVSYVGLLGATNPSFPVVVSPVNTTPPCLRLSSPTSPTTVTTTTVASTTDTPTTTMASTTRANGVVSTTTTSNESMKFMPDVLVRRLVEKWWGSDLQAKKINETAASYMHLHLLDDALKFCNASLEKSPTNFKSLLLRAEVLRKMNHYQSSLADVDNALKARYTSAKAHYMRALALSNLSRFEEALYETCLAISLDKMQNLSNTELFQHDLTKVLQKLLSQTPKCIKFDLTQLRQKAPYSVFTEQRLRRKKIALLTNTVDEDESMPSYEEDEEDFLSVSYAKECDILVEDEDVLACSDFLNCVEKRSTYASIAKKYELELRKQTSRKHFRRKWMSAESELLPSLEIENGRCSSQFRNVLERTQQEIVRLKKMDSLPDADCKQLITVPPSLIDPSDFDCVLCCRTFWKPVVTPCGHTYCLVCLDRCMDYTASCPLCMSALVEPSVNVYQGSSTPVPLILTKRPVTKFLEAAMKRFIPESYAKRFRQEMVMEPSVPIFICTTAFPYVPCPLFVYEPRYRLMVRRAVESGDKQFGIVQPHSGKPRYYDYGTILDIRDCVLLGDGCSILSTIGCKRFKILARSEKDGYETAKVEYICDEPIPDESLTYVSNMHSIVLAKAIEWYESLGEDLKHEILQSYGEMPTVEENWETITDGPAWAWWIIALLPLRPQLKVDILATTSLEKRLRAIEKTINSMPGNYRYQRVSQDCNVSVVVHSDQQHEHHSHHLPEEDDGHEQQPMDLQQELPTDETHVHLQPQPQHTHHITQHHHHHHHHHHNPRSPHHRHHEECDNATATADECCARTTAALRANDDNDHHSANNRNEHTTHTPHSLML